MHCLHVTPAVLASWIFLAHSPVAAAMHATSLQRPAASARNAVLFDERPDASLWVRGVDWKAHFGPVGVAFVPYLGAAAPRNFPLEFGVPRISAGERTVELDAHASPVREEATIRFDRGIVDELYVVSSHAIEQRFVIETSLGSGDLVVHVPIASELEPSVDGSTLRFTNAWGGVEYGGATAIDASGRTLALERTFDGDAIRIVVPAEFAESARYPLVVDPVVSAFGVFTGTPQTESSPDVAYDTNSEQYLVVTEVAFSAADHDVLSILVFRDGSPVPGSELAVDASAEYWATPRCANIGFFPEFGVVAAVGVPGPFHRSIRVRVRSGGAYTAPVTVSDADDGDPSAPDIAGGDQMFNPNYGVTWQSRRSGGDVDILARRVLRNGTVSGSVASISVDPAFRDELPSISTGALSGLWEIVWQREVSVSDHDIWFAAYSFQDVLVTPPTGLVTTPEDDRSPSVSDNGMIGLRCLIAFEREVGGDRNIVVVGHAPDLSVAHLVDISALDPATAGREQFGPVIESDGERLVVVWSERSGSSTELLAAEFHVSGSTPLLGLRRVPITTLTADARGVRLAGRTFVDGPHLGVLAVWTDDAVAGGRDVFGARYEPAIGIPARPVCFGDGTGAACPCANVGGPGRGCPNSLQPAGALLGFAGTAAMEEDTFVLHGSAMPPNVACLYFQAHLLVSPATPFGDGLRCGSGTTIRLGTKLNSPTGSSQYPSVGDAPISVRGLLPTIGGRRYYQGWYRNAAAFCTSATFNLTNALEVDWTVL